jgi:hypothetical protein
LRFVPIKNDVQLDNQALHRVRSFYLKQRTALINTMRVLLAESGVAVAKRKTQLMNALTVLLEDECEQLGQQKEAC